MNRALQWKLIAGFILVFVAGGMTGAFLGAAYARHLFFEVHQPGLMAIRMRDRLRTELHLTPEQVAKISPIIDKTATNLTDDQRLKLQEIESRHRHWHGFHDSRHGPSASPESSAQPQ